MTEDHWDHVELKRKVNPNNNRTSKHTLLCTGTMCSVFFHVMLHVLAHTRELIGQLHKINGTSSRALVAPSSSACTDIERMKKFGKKTRCCQLATGRRQRKNNGNATTRGGAQTGPDNTRRATLRRDAVDELSLAGTASVPVSPNIVLKTLD